MLTVMTLNTWQERGPWKERWNVVLEGLKKYKPDVFCLQETFNGDWIKQVQKRAGFHYLVFAEDRCGLTIFSQLPVARWDWMTMQNQSSIESYLRYALYAQLRYKDSSFHIFNTHLSWKLDDGATREKQVEELIDYIDEKAGVEEAMAVGDFNAPPDTSEIRKMATLGKFNDAYAVKHPKNPGLTWDNRNPYAKQSNMPDRRLDYLFIRNQAKLLGKLISVELAYTEPSPHGIYATDHFGVISRFS